MSQAQRRTDLSAALLLAGAALLGVLACAFPAGGSALSGREAAWLDAGRGLVAALADRWIGAVSGDGLMRLPFFLAAALIPVLLASAWLRLRPGALATAGGAAALGALLAVGMARVQIIGPALLAALVAAAAFRLTASRRSPLVIAVGLLAVAAIGASVETGAAAVPLGMAVGALLSGPRGRFSRVFLGLAAILLLAALRQLPPELWALAGGEQPVKVLLALAALATLAWCALRRTDEAGTPPAVTIAAASGGLIAGAAWLAIPFLRGSSLAPMAAVAALLSATTAGWIGAVGIRRAPYWVAAAAAAAAWVLGSTAKPPEMPLGAAFAELASKEPEVREVLVGPGLSEGAVRHAALATKFRVVETPGSERVALIQMPSARPAGEERHALVAALGDGVTSRYGLVSSSGESVLWAVLRPVEVRTLDRQSRPNIAIIAIDTLRADHLSLYGYGRSTSPILDRWASGPGVTVFRRALSTAGKTAPSFASLLTGRLPSAHGVRSNYSYLSRGEWPLARILKHAGYDTAAFVSSYVLSGENSGLDLGFDLYDDRFEELELNRRERPVRLAPALVRAVEPWLDEHLQPAKPPWFLWIHAIDPHGPYTPLPQFEGLFHDERVQPVERRRIPAYQWIGTDNYYEYVDRYDAEIRQTDTFLAPLLEKISSNTDEETILIFVADHGEALGERGVYFEHGQSLHAEHVHVPLVVFDSLGSRNPAAVEVTEPVSLLDIVPMLLERAGVETDLPLDGMPVHQRATGGTIILGGHRPGEVYASRGSIKLILDVRGGDQERVEIFDMGADPKEAIPLAATPAQWTALLEAARAAVRSDPLSARGGRDLRQRELEGLSEDAIKNLRSLGYVDN